MMTAIFAAMSLALVGLHGASPRLALACALAGLAMAAGLFLFEIHDPVDGFRMPWLQVLGPPGEAARPA